jgi:hypothetical protein
MMRVLTVFSVSTRRPATLLVREAGRKQTKHLLTCAERAVLGRGHVGHPHVAIRVDADICPPASLSG